jgi:hypothetical protein
VSKGFRVFRLEPSLFHQLDINGGARGYFSSSNLSRLLQMLPKLGKETKKLVVQNGQISPKDWTMILKACSSNMRVFKVTGKSFANSILKSMPKYKCTELVSLSLNEIHNPDSLLDSDIASILRTTPNVKILKSQLSIQLCI